MILGLLVSWERLSDHTYTLCLNNNSCACFLEKAMAPHSSTLAWKIPWMEEPGRLQSMGSLRVGYDWATSLSLFTFMYWRRKWQPTPVFLPGESQGWGSLMGCRHGVAQTQTRLKQLSSSSSLFPFWFYFFIKLLWTRLSVGICFNLSWTNT